MNFATAILFVVFLFILFIIVIYGLVAKSYDRIITPFHIFYPLRHTHGEYQTMFTIDGNNIWGTVDTGSSNCVILSQNYTPKHAIDTEKSHFLSFKTASVSGKWYRGTINNQADISYLVGHSTRGTVSNIFGLTKSSNPSDNSFIMQLRNRPIVTLYFKPDHNADGYLTIGKANRNYGHSSSMISQKNINSIRGWNGAMYPTLLATSIKARGKELLLSGKSMYCVFDTGTTNGLVPPFIKYGKNFHYGDEITLTFYNGSKMKLTVRNTKIMDTNILGENSMVIGNEWMQGKTFTFDFETNSIYW